MPRLLQFGWCTDCESKRKAFLERLAQRYPKEYQLPMPDPPHNIKSVRSSLFWYSKTSFEKNCFSAWASTLNMGLINKVDMVCLSPVGYGV